MARHGAATSTARSAPTPALRWRRRVPCAGPMPGGASDRGHLGPAHLVREFAGRRSRRCARHPGRPGAPSATMRALVRAGDDVLFAVPICPGAVAVARSAALVPVPVPAGADGLSQARPARGGIPDGPLPPAVPPADPDCHVPAPSRRADVLAIASRPGALAIEDDWARWLGRGRSCRRRSSVTTTPDPRSPSTRSRRQWHRAGASAR